MQVKANIKEYKIFLRNKYKKIRLSMNPRRKAKMDKNILKRVISLREYSKEDTLFTYVSKPIEVDTLKIIEKALKDSKKVAVPKCITTTRGMDFYYINSLDDLEIGTFGVLEPIESKCEKVTDLNHGLCIVPGFSFDRFGYRLGYGMGYYDRFLSNFKGSTVGLCYYNCMKKELPHGYYDKPVDIMVTDVYIKTLKKDKKYINSKFRRA